ncbi:MAG: hypothetical protein II820_11200 [Ruminiclostridium sp.]|nr:hypothetical protein [Ruminiclostridium sp.]
MAYQHLFGSATGGSSGAGYRTLAATEEFYNVMSDDELSSYNNYSFIGDHPVKFYCCYKEYKQCFIQSAISFEYDYVGRDSSVAYTLVLNENETKKILDEHIRPFNPDMFINSKSGDFARPRSEKLPSVQYRFDECTPREHNAAFISKYFRSDIFAQFLLSLFLSAENGNPIFVALPGSYTEASRAAVELMNIIIPAFPAEYRKKLGFMTHVTDTYAVEDISIYFVSGIDLSRQYMNSAYCFDISSEKPYISGVDSIDVKEYFELLRTVMSNILSYDFEALNGFFNDILPKLDARDRYNLEKINEIYFMWKFLSGTEETQLDSDTACTVISSFYSFYNMVDNKAQFLNRINGYWEKEIEKCKAGGYAPSMAVFDIVDGYYKTFGEDDRRQAQRIWSFALIYTVSENNFSIYNRLTSPDYDHSQLAEDVFMYISYIYIGFLQRRDKNASIGAVYEKIAGGYGERETADGNSTRIIRALGLLAAVTEKYYEDMGLKKVDQYEFYSAGFLKYYDEPVSKMLKEVPLTRKFDLMNEIKNAVHAEDNPISPDDASLGKNIYDHFHNGAFLPAVAEGFTNDSVSAIAGDRKLVSQTADDIAEYPGLANFPIVSLFQHFSAIINGTRDLIVLRELSELVNKPDMQEMLTGWVKIYCSANPELTMLLFANTRCHIDDKGIMVYETDFFETFRMYYDDISHDNEKMMHELNQFAGELESASNRAEYKALGLSAYKEPTARFINAYLFDKYADKKAYKENEARVKKYDRIKFLRTLAPAPDKKRKRFGKK